MAERIIKPDGGNDMVIANDDSSASLKIKNDGTNQITGNVTFNDGNLVIGTAGKGIDFSEAQTPSAGMTAEILDSYEEGTFGGTGANDSIYPSGSGTISCSSSYLSYTKIGNTCHIFGWVRTTSESSAVGYLRLKLPFNTNPIQGAGSWLHYLQDTTGNGTGLYFPGSDSYASPQTNQDDGAWGYVEYDSGAYLYFGGMYFVA